ncbi:hypothetical protein HPB50_000391 [Hyalomma asiaticum]|uniref:Uncharacterized protein n=1 Tax=Hyalomma asiaticum TaxID=266040 RepID=A0ACB7SAM1_HYAAI|nr:hypothetical protein HPB50_000391 [Hyalomma asiaticum]
MHCPESCFPTGHRRVNKSFAERARFSPGAALTPRDDVDDDDKDDPRYGVAAVTTRSREFACAKRRRCMQTRRPDSNERERERESSLFLLDVRIPACSPQCLGAERAMAFPHLA